jgi:hypothetical protein
MSEMTESTHELQIIIYRSPFYVWNILEIVCNNNILHCIRGQAVVQWLRHCATNRKVAGSIPDDVTGFFH